MSDHEVSRHAAIAAAAELDDEQEQAGQAEHPYHRVPRAVAPSQVYSIRLPVDRIEELRVLAAESDERPTSLIRRWVLEHLDEASPHPQTNGTARHATDQFRLSWFLRHPDSSTAAHTHFLEHSASTEVLMIFGTTRGSEGSENVANESTVDREFERLTRSLRV